ncbi:alpha/beta hydrolase [Burkholderia ubonensis]|uniref:Alpha/beta hydrolase n=1 Tax=Burkholderia ubonensis subsp. mesacidophila TaxID=265293 RepID=A0A2A4FGE1_9BURK|nr:alpha/beta hydrolase [Burkholderia ubonensis]PCE31740.1 alpha/beta hydrolase [Burkholderia ubonensis subsp. mesacidophila]
MSWQSKFACWLLRWQFRPETARPVLDPARARRFTDLRMWVPRRAPAGYRLRECYGPDDAPLRGEWLERVEVGPGQASGRTLLYFHGGGYYFCSSRTHRQLVFGLTKRAGVRSFSLDYRLAPEHRFPAALDDALAAYRRLLDAGTPPESIVLGGDSAGGGLALATLVALRDRGEPLPAGAILFSPWTDLAATGDTLRTNDGIDPMFASAAFPKAAKLYLGDASPTHPYASPLYADFTGLPPLFIQVASNEVLLDDSRRVADKAKAAGVAVEIEIRPDVPHVWQLYAPMVPESRQALDRAAAFLRRVAVERAVQRVGDASIA